MSERTAYEQAKANVEARSPAPKYEPSDAGIFGAVTVGVGAAMFAAAAGLDIEDFATAFALTALIGFLAPYLYVRSKHNKHTRLVVEELDYLLKREKDAQRPQRTEAPR